MITTVLLTVDLPMLECLCGARIYPADTDVSLSGYPLLPAALTLRRKTGSMSTPTQYESDILGGERELLARADEAGWRKLNLYGREVFVCPACRLKHPRTRPEWERRLTEAPDHG